jgi:hypothetical protein
MIKVSAVGAHLTLNWPNHATNVTAITIEAKSNVNKPFVRIATIGPTSTSYVDMGRAQENDLLLSRPSSGSRTRRDYFPFGGGAITGSGTLLLIGGIVRR